MATPEEMRRMREFFGPQTYGDQDANAMPDMFNEIDPTSESYLGVPVDEYGEKLNPTGRAMDRALRRFFGTDVETMPLADDMVGLDEGGEDSNEDSLSRATAEFEADTLGEMFDDEVLEGARGQDDEMVAMDDYALATAGPTPEGMDERGEDFQDPDPAQGMAEDALRSILGLGGDSEPFMDASDLNDRFQIPSMLMAAVGPAKIKAIASALQSGGAAGSKAYALRNFLRGDQGGAAAQKALPRFSVPRQLTGTAQRSIPSPNLQIPGRQVLPRNVRPTRNFTGGRLPPAYRNELMRTGMQNQGLMSRGFGGARLPEARGLTNELQRRALGRGEFGMGGRQGGRLPQFLQRFFE